MHVHKTVYTLCELNVSMFCIVELKDPAHDNGRLSLLHRVYDYEHSDCRLFTGWCSI